MNAYINILVLSLVILLMTTSCGKSTSNYNTQVGVIHRDVKDTVFQTPHGYTFYDIVSQNLDI